MPEAWQLFQAVASLKQVLRLEAVVLCKAVLFQKQMPINDMAATLGFRAGYRSCCASSNNKLQRLKVIKFRAPWTTLSNQNRLNGHVPDSDG